jgi:hypothetical protein
LYAYTSLLCPGGYTKNQGQSSSSVFRVGTAMASPRIPISEVERAKINQVISDQSKIKYNFISKSVLDHKTYNMFRPI